VAGLVIEHSLDNMGKDTKLGHLGRASATEIMQAPFSDPQSRVELCLCHIPIVETTLAKHKLGRITSRQRGQDSVGLGGQWDRMLAVILYPLRGQHDHLAHEIDLVQLELSNFISPLAGQ
jgi:hypothetical protein